MITAAAKNQSMSMSSLLMAGDETIKPAISKFIMSADDFRNVVRLLRHTVHVYDIFLLTVLGWMTVPFFGLVFYLMKREKANIYPYDKSTLFLIADHISQVARLAILLYAVDCIIVILTGLGFHFSQIGTLSTGFAKILYIAWGAQRLSVFKRYLLGRAASRAPEKLGRLSAVDRLVDGMIYICTGLFLLDTLDVEMGIGVKSVFALGSAGTLVFGLASKDIAAMFVSGVALSTSDRIRKGDDVKFGDGTTGAVDNVGWMQTTIRGYDELVETIPNNELGMQRVKNLSRIDKCRYRETLRFHYEDAEKLPQVMEDILEEIKQSIPEAITDGSRPFRAFWTAYREDFLECFVQVHFNIKPIGQPYWENRQKVNLAILRAVKKNKVEFVTTFYPRFMKTG